MENKRSLKPPTRYIYIYSTSTIHYLEYSSIYEMENNPFMFQTTKQHQNCFSRLESENCRWKLIDNPPRLEGNPAEQISQRLRISQKSAPPPILVMTRWPIHWWNPSKYAIRMPVIFHSYSMNMPLKPILRDKSMWNSFKKKTFCWCLHPHY